VLDGVFIVLNGVFNVKGKVLIMIAGVFIALGKA
jgi:hypothetical protein